MQVDQCNDRKIVVVGWFNYWHKQHLTVGVCLP